MNQFAESEIMLYAKKIAENHIEQGEKWAIYGTGKGAELIFLALGKLNLSTHIKYVIERDDKVASGMFFNNIPLVKLSEVVDKVDGIIIAAINSHQIIMQRLLDNLSEPQQTKIRLLDIFSYTSNEEKKEYLEYLEKSILKQNGEFVTFSQEKIDLQKNDTKVIAWYLPQYHQMEINNQFHGQGFTEWVNTSRCIPMYTGHYQPHIPYDVGYYDLLNIETLKRQVYLAKQYGIYGFCFHYYWFSGKRIMEKPLEMFLEHKELSFPFCIDWATENWTKLWDGGNNEIMLEQKLEADDDRKFMDDILPYMKDSRYIKIEGKPLLVIYKIKMFEKEKAKQLLESFRIMAKKAGFPDLFILLANSYDFEENVAEWGADALVEFPAHGIVSLMENWSPNGYINPYFKGVVKDASKFIENKKYMLSHNSNAKYFRSALTSWDNTARKATTNALIFHGLTPQTFKQWLVDIMKESKKIHSKSEDIVFVNSWNEWAEGSHMEPDMKYGYAWLQACKEALEEMRR